MATPSLGLRAKIALPLTLTVLLVASATAVIAVTVISRDLERRLASRIDRTADLVAASDFAVNPRVLGMIEEITDAEIVVFAPDGAILATTLVGASAADLARQIVEQVPAASASGGLAGPGRILRFDDQAFRVAYRRLATRSDAVVALAFDLEALERGRGVLIFTVAVLSLVVVLIATLFVHLVARLVTSPLDRLVAHTRTLAGGKLDERAPVTGGDEIGRLGAAFDDMARDLRALEEKLVRGEKLVLTGQLAARVAHDIRNPLASLKIQAQMLAHRELPGDENRRSVEAILGEIGRIERVVDGLLSLSRPTALHTEPRDLDEVVGSALDIAASQLDHQRIEVERRLAGDLPPVAVDADALTRALLDLVQNAVEAQPDGGELQVATRRASDGSRVEIRLCDRGCGIDPTAAERLFDPFYTTKRDGVGLGLMNSRDVVVRHHGELSLEPRPGGGTCAILSLPLAEPGAGDASGAATVESPDAAGVAEEGADG